MKDPRPRGRRNGKLREAVFRYYGTVCWLCGYEGAVTIDHLVMISQGGTNELDNLRPAHGRKSDFCVGNFSRKRGVSARPLKRTPARVIYQENESIYYE